MNVRIRKGWEIPEARLTPEPVYRSRRDVLRALGFTGLGALAWSVGCDPKLVDAESLPWSPVNVRTDNPNAGLYPATRNLAYPLDRALTAEQSTATYNNYYEFSTNKAKVWQLAENFVTRPWRVEIGGLVEAGGEFEVDDLVREFGLEERTYRHRCVEAWAMAVPWTGFPFRRIVDKVRPTSAATHVRLVTFLDEALPGVADAPWYAWPYYEGMTLAEATNELAFVATGIYGHELPTQNGAPWRLVLPWKYGFKSLKAMVRIEFTDSQPATFWNDAVPDEYDFLANVDPTKPHPRWSQAHERLIDTGEMVPTQPFNGYGEWVAAMYAGR
ncbi:MAG: protein-methionine-sulfoxide reductase catalytic subunit MsrP [bacterium]